MRVTVIGTGYVGAVTGACLAYLGHRVTCVDTDAAKIDALQSGRSPIYEPGLDEIPAFPPAPPPSVSKAYLSFTAVAPPPLASGDPNLSYLEAAARSIGAAMDTS